jgi:5-(aminomethyl)-3-furanmethanol phosphate kinase
VVKLGGSLAESMRLASILDIVGRARAPVVIVPGGGAFADAVRRAQADFEFSDEDAHRMALLAMHQSGLMLASLHPRLAPIETLAGLRKELDAGRIPVWLPYKMSQRDKRVSADWSTTSDGLAARLAERLGGATVVLVKSCRILPGSAMVSLVFEGIVDPTFAAIVDRADLAWHVVGAGDEVQLAALIDARERHGHSRRQNQLDAGRRAVPARAIARRR